MLIRPLLAALAMLVATAGVPAAGDGPGAAIDAAIAEAQYENGHWGLLVVDLEDGATVLERNADRMFAPASVTKVFSCAAALAELGADHRFRTPVVRRGEVDAEGALKGDLILVAAGDLCLGGRTGPDGSLGFRNSDHTYAGGGTDAELVSDDPLAPLAGLDAMAREVAEGGIRSVSGDVLIDDRLFEAAESSGSGPSRVSPIVVNDNVIDFVIAPGSAVGEPAEVRTVPPSAWYAVDAQVETVAADAKPALRVRSVGPRRFAVRGSIPVGHAPIVRIGEVDDPSGFARALLIERLRTRGVKIDASPLGTNDAAALPAREKVAELPAVAEYTSPPFREYLRVILKVSHNLHASTLPLLLAAKAGRRTLGDGLTREGEALKGLGLDLNGVSFGGGAGGTRADLATPRATVSLLRTLAGRDDFEAFEGALPILGRDGTSAKHVGLDSKARGHVRAKTGTYWVENDLDGRGMLTSKALAGYIETASGRKLAFAFFVNNVPLDARGDDVSAATAAAGRLLGRLCEIVYDD